MRIVTGTNVQGLVNGQLLIEMTRLVVTGFVIAQHVPVVSGLLEDSVLRTGFYVYFLPLSP